MDEIQKFIQNGRQSGHSDQEIRDLMLATGWPPDQVNAAFGPGTQAAPPQPSPPPPVPQPQIQSPIHQQSPAVMERYPGQPDPDAAGKQRKIALLALGIILAVGAVGSLLISVSEKQPVTKQNAPVAQRVEEPHEKAVNQLIEAMQNKDKTKADSLISDELKKAVEEATGTDSLYDACQEAGEFCAGVFTKEHLAKAEKTGHDYISDTGVSGKEVRYTVTESMDTADCQSESKSILHIAAVEIDGKWLIDDVDPEFEGNAESCAAGLPFEPEN